MVGRAESRAALRFAKSIEAALEECDAVIVVWSAKSVGSDWVLDEAAKGATCTSSFRSHSTAPLRRSVFANTSPSAFRTGKAVRMLRKLETSSAVFRRQHANRSCGAGLGGGAKHAVLSRRGFFIGAAGATLAGVAGLFAWRQGVFGRRLASGNSVAVHAFQEPEW